MQEKKRPVYFRVWFLAIIVVVAALTLLWYTDANRHPCDLRGELFFTAECKIFRANSDILAEADYVAFENTPEGEYVHPTLGVVLRFAPLVQSEANEENDPEDTAVYFEFDERISLENGVSRIDHREITKQLFIDLAPIDDRALEIIVLNGNCKNDSFPNRSAFHQLNADADIDSASIIETSFEANIEWARECIAFKDFGKYPSNIDHTVYQRIVTINSKSN
jgi:hypothetical protein